ncbi:MAG: 1-deoxy-D-xylulose-5-phosphate synthase [bacterium]|nr:1-deoxy-D-xylulose-5-phosphate synthase [bacterium]
MEETRSLLETITSPKELKKLNPEQLKDLAGEIRDEIVQTVSQTGGHLSSSLGVVELTIALHYVLNTPEDKIIWDVGHQSYAHKLLTGRKKAFRTLRNYEGISGFPRRQESPYDAFNTGHASTSISAGLGMAIANEFEGSESNKIVVVIGDGSLSGGMAFEALNHAGQLQKDLFVVLNSNEMSISKTVGALSSYLNRLLTMPIYSRLRGDIQELITKIPRLGSPMSTLVKRVEEGIKNILIHGGLFEELGFRYFGPIDGHNLGLLINVIGKINELKGPRLLHVFTKKGKGYPPAQKNPEWFHGTSPFEISTGNPLKVSKFPSYAEVMGQTVVELAKNDPKIVTITAAMVEGTGLSHFKKAFPDRFFDVGIAEEHAVTLAAGMAVAGLKPIVAIYSTFLQRAYDQILHDVCLSKLPVVFCIDRAGLVGEDGPTHQGLFDLAYLRHIPDLTVMSPKDTTELVLMLNLAIASCQPCAIRYPRGCSEQITQTQLPFKIGQAEVLVEGENGVILALGKMVDVALAVANNLNLKIGVVNARFVKPLDEELILNLAKKTKRIITLEDHITTGGFGSAVLELLNANQINDVRVKCLGFPSTFIEHGAPEILFKKYGLDVEGITQSVEKF